MPVAKNTTKYSGLGLMDCSATAACFSACSALACLRLVPELAATPALSCCCSCCWLLLTTAPGWTDSIPLPAPALPAPVPIGCSGCCWLLLAMTTGWLAAPAAPVSNPWDACCCIFLDACDGRAC